MTVFVYEQGAALGGVNENFNSVKVNIINNVKPGHVTNFGTHQLHHPLKPEEF